MPKSKTATAGSRGSFPVWLVGLSLAASNLVAEAAEVSGSLAAGVAHSDNVRLTTADTQDETVFLIEPSLTVEHAGERTSALLDYQLQWYRFDAAKETEVFHSYVGTGRYEFVPEQVFVDVGASRFQSIRDSLQPIAANNLPLIGNRIDRDDYFVSPGFDKLIGSSIRAAGSLRQTWVEVDGNNLQGNEQRFGVLSVDNYTAGEGFAWALQYDWQRVIYDVAEPYEFQRARLEVGYWLTSRLRVFAAGGRESDWEIPLDPAPEAGLWEAGLTVQLGTDSTFTVATGERSFGASSRLEFSFRNRRQSLELSFVQEPTTQGLQRLLQGGPSSPDLISDILSAEGQSQRFISNRASLDWSVQLRRLTFRARAFLEDRSDITTALGAVLPDQEQINAGISVDYQLGARTRVAAGLTRLGFDIDDGNESDILQASLNLAYDIGSRTALLFEYSYADQQNVTPGAVNPPDFFANIVSLRLRRQF